LEWMCASRCVVHALTRMLFIHCADATATEISLKHIEGKVVEKIVEYLNYHASVRIESRDLCLSPQFSYLLFVTTW
jgi:hypothetical protein